MITKLSTTAAILALTGAAVLLPSPADAAIVYTDGDLLLGFRATGGQGASTDYLVKLGNAESILTSTSPIVFSVGAIGADLVNIYGANWVNRADVLWSVSGTQFFAAGIYPNRTMFVTRADDIDGQLGTNTTTPWPRVSLSGSGTPAGKIGTQMGGQYGLGTTGATAADQMESTLAPGALIQPTGITNSYASFQPGGINTVGSTAYGQFPGGIEENFANGTTSAVLDAYTLTPGSGASTFSGNFTVNDAGVVTFTPGVVPEPTAAIALLLGGTLLASRRSRRSSVNAS